VLDVRYKDIVYYKYRNPIFIFDIKRSDYLENKILRKLFLGFIQIHILHHANKEPIYGSWMLQELREHSYNISPGTLYPILHNMEVDQLLEKEEVNVNGKIRKYYRITDKGKYVLNEARKKAYELFNEIKE
jgi:DNA-binding PadR family transcriptional regulator